MLQGAAGSGGASHRGLLADRQHAGQKPGPPLRACCGRHGGQHVRGRRQLRYAHAVRTAVTSSLAEYGHSTTPHCAPSCSAGVRKLCGLVRNELSLSASHHQAGPCGASSHHSRCKPVFLYLRGSQALWPTLRGSSRRLLNVLTAQIVPGRDARDRASHMVLLLSGGSHVPPAQPQGAACPASWGLVMMRWQHLLCQPLVNVKSRHHTQSTTHTSQALDPLAHDPAVMMQRPITTGRNCMHVPTAPLALSS